MIMKRELGKKGQIVIPKDIRKMLGLREGQKVVFQTKGDQVCITPEQSPEEFLEDFLNVPKLKKLLTIKDIKKILEEQYELP